VSSKKDISLIRKYLNGELDARAMHELERQAQDDPFLMDALEGYEQATSDQRANLDDLTNRLYQRINKKERRIIPWIPLSVAASILIILGAGIWFMTNDQPQKRAKVVEVEKPATHEKAVITLPAKPQNNKQANDIKPDRSIANSKKFTDIDNEQLGEADKLSAPAISSPATANSSPLVSEPVPNSDIKPIGKLYKEDSVPLNEIVVSNYKPKKKDTANVERLLQGRVAGVAVTQNNPTGNSATLKTINGIVIGKDDGQPIVGATVKIVGKSFGAVTDVHGKFVLPGVASNQTLAVGYIGYNSRQVKVNNKDSLNIALEPNNSSLSEVVVTGYATQNKESETVNEDAHPRDGWHAMDEYLKKNAISPDGKTGKVRLSFIVGEGGSLSNTKVIKSLSAATDQKAIDLINNGPAWAGATDRKPHEIRISVKFH
jgi:cytoskeletal protein RodZ